jgi:hypothetical protein
MAVAVRLRASTVPSSVASGPAGAAVKAKSASGTSKGVLTVVTQPAITMSIAEVKMLRTDLGFKSIELPFFCGVVVDAVSSYLHV